MAEKKSEKRTMRTIEEPRHMTQADADTPSRRRTRQRHKKSDAKTSGGRQDARLKSTRSTRTGSPRRR